MDVKGKGMAISIIKDGCDFLRILTRRSIPREKNMFGILSIKSGYGIQAHQQQTVLTIYIYYIILTMAFP